MQYFSLTQLLLPCIHYKHLCNVYAVYYLIHCFKPWIEMHWNYIYKCFLLFLFFFFPQIILDQFQYFSFYKNDKIVLFFRFHPSIRTKCSSSIREQFSVFTEKWSNFPLCQYQALNAHFCSTSWKHSMMHCKLFNQLSQRGCLRLSYRV